MIRERLFLNKVVLEELEMDMLNRRHIERYALVRSRVHGRVLDAGCGCGYGSYLLAKNPDIEQVYGIDTDRHTIDYAGQEYAQAGRVRFALKSIQDVRGEYECIVALEVAEHIDRPADIVDMAHRLNAQKVIVSFPTKKTTHYNIFHKHDLTVQEMVGIFHHWWLEEHIVLYHEMCVLVFGR